MRIDCRIDGRSGLGLPPSPTRRDPRLRSCRPWFGLPIGHFAFCLDGISKQNACHSAVRLQPFDFSRPPSGIGGDFLAADMPSRIFGPNPHPPKHGPAMQNVHLFPFAYNYLGHS
jgi:hypothetical protein